MKRCPLLIGVLILVLTGCNSTVSHNSNVAVNSNSTVTINRSPAAASASTPAIQNNNSSGATKVIEKFVADAKKGELEAMNKAFSKEAMQQRGAKIKSNNKSYSEMIRALDSKAKPEIFGMREKIDGDKVIVQYNYGIARNGVGVGESTGCTAFELIKEDGEWKVNDSPMCQ